MSGDLDAIRALAAQDVRDCPPPPLSDSSRRVITSRIPVAQQAASDDAA